MSECSEENVSVESNEDDCIEHNSSLECNFQHVADKSILGKVKSRVSSILPNRISKWFTATSTTPLNDNSLNDSFTSTNNLTKRRRHVDDDNDDLDIEVNGNEENNDTNEVPTEQTDNYRFQRSSSSNIRRNIESDIRQRNIPVEDDDYEEHEDMLTGNTNSERETSSLEDKNLAIGRHIPQQPPAKRSRIENNSSLTMSRQSFVASTPATNNNNNNMQQHFHPSSTAQRSSSSYNNHSRYINMKLSSSRALKNDSAYDFSKAVITTAANTNFNLNSPWNSLHNRQETSGTSSNVHLEQSAGSCNQTIISSRKILNIPPLSMLHLKRQPLSSVKMKNDTKFLRTTPTIHEIINDNNDDYDDSYDVDNKALNGSLEVSKDELSSSLNTKKQKLVNGSTDRMNETITLIDTASESGDSNDNDSTASRNVIDGNESKRQFNRRKKDAYNSTTTTGKTGTNSNGNDYGNKRRYEHGHSYDLSHGSRTASYGNGLNFQSHLEGHKSLFASASNNTVQGTVFGNNTLNNSTSLSSLNRRQFNASIYGSTSALSDSRLLNTFSPFYKGKTTYGGAAAYNKYYGSGITGVNSTAMRITPTIIRPTSSLSNLSTSSTSLLNISKHPYNSTYMNGNNSAISSTAKRILELITDINTPLSEAKKMAHNLRAPPQARKSLNDNDTNAIKLSTSQVVRLSRAPKPYSRPNSAVLLQNKRNRSSTLPPVKELQVPSMSQLLQMKKMQNITEKARDITVQNIKSNSTAGVSSISMSTTMPTSTTRLDVSTPSSSCAESDLSTLNYVDQKQLQLQTHCLLQQEQQQYTNKIKSKMNIIDVTPPVPPNLPNIQFPLMQSRPTFDIQLPVVATTESNAPRPLLSSSSSSSALTTTTTTAISELTAISQTAQDFKFSSPLRFDSMPKVSQNDVVSTSKCINNYKFSSPTNVVNNILNRLDSTTVSRTSSAPAPPLKNGSVLEVLNKKSNISDVNTSTENTKVVYSVACLSNKNDLPQSPRNQWECNNCWIRNKTDVNNCAACGVVRPNTNMKTAVATPTNSNPTVSFGNRFKKINGEWDCDMCMVRNKLDAMKCVACETERQNVTLSSQSSLSSSTLPLPVNNTFGDAFKSKADTWECKICLVINKIEVNECVACQSKRSTSTLSSDTSKSHITVPSSSVPANFGFSNAQIYTSPTILSATTDADFKAIASQQTQSKWECEACMTRNDSNRKKCICCEQRRPGLMESDDINNESNTSKFVFGATLTSKKYTFGFGSTLGVQKENNLQEKSSELSQNKNTLFGSQTNNEIGNTSQTQLDHNTKDIFDGEFKLQQNETKTAISSGLMVDSSNVTSATATMTSTECSGSILVTDSNNKDSNANFVTSTIATAATTTETFTFNSGNRINQEKYAPCENMFKVSASTFSTASNTLTSASGFTFGSPVKQQDTNNLTSNATSTTILTAPTVKSTLSIPATTICSSNSSSNSCNNSINNRPLGGFAFGASTLNVDTKANVTEIIGTKPVVSTITTIFNTQPANITVNSGSNVNPIATTSTTVTNNAPLSNIFGGIVSSCTNSPTINTSSNFLAIPNNNINSNNKLQSSNLFSSFNMSKPGIAVTTQSLFDNSSNTSSSFTFGLTPTKPTFKTTESDATTPTSSIMVANTSNETPVTATTTLAPLFNTSTVWPKNNSIFGKNNNEITSDEQKQQQQNVSDGATLFAFGSNNNKAPSVFGSTVATATTTVLTTPPNNENQSANVFDNMSSSSTLPKSQNAIFGTNKTAAPLLSNIFSAAPSTSAHVFGNTTFGGAPSSSPSLTVATSMPTFGSSSMTSKNPTFGGFSIIAPNETKNASVETQQPSNSLSFTFGANNNTASTSQNVGFNFGSNVTKISTPVFNFGSGAGSGTVPQPTFNFTGLNDPSQNVVKPFQFGATPTTPFYKFTGGATEVAPNAPFQFNAAPTPVSNNIFAPTPIPGATSTQTRRKVRPATRRLTPR